MPWALRQEECLTCKVSLDFNDFLNLYWINNAYVLIRKDVHFPNPVVTNPVHGDLPSYRFYLTHLFQWIKTFLSQ